MWNGSVKGSSAFTNAFERNKTKISGASRFEEKLAVVVGVVVQAYRQEERLDTSPNR